MAKGGGVCVRHVRACLSVCVDVAFVPTRMRTARGGEGRRRLNWLKPTGTAGEISPWLTKRWLSRDDREACGARRCVVATRDRWGEGGGVEREGRWWLEVTKIMTWLGLWPQSRDASAAARVGLVLCRCSLSQPTSNERQTSRPSLLDVAPSQPPLPAVSDTTANFFQT